MKRPVFVIEKSQPVQGNKFNFKLYAESLCQHTYIFHRRNNKGQPIYKCVFCERKTYDIKI